MTNPNKIAFLYCYNNEDELNASIEHVNALNVPDGMVVEIVTVSDQVSITSGYNNAMKQTDAKYKVYLHQDLKILHQDFIQDIITVFETDASIGMIGMIGAKKLDAGAVWWFSPDLYGRVIDNTRGPHTTLCFNPIYNLYEEVEAVDGLLMATQYDVPWRDDIFTGWHYYDLSQAQEVIRAGYKVVIPNQGNESWCYHDAGHGTNAGGFEEFKAVFINEYMQGRA